MRFIARQARIPAALLCIAALSTGCAQLAGIEETTCSVRHAYACKCACTGGGETFSLNNDVCLPASLNPALNPDLPPDFAPTPDDLRQDCETRVESNLEQMARQCVADRIRCSCAGIAELTPSCNDCDSPCAGEDLAADCSNFDPQVAPPTATNVPGQPPVCIAGPPGSATPPAFASALFGQANQCQVDGSVTVTRDGDTRTPEATGVAEFTGAPCPGGQCAVGLSYDLDHVDNFSFDGFGGFTSVEFKDITAAGTSGPETALLDPTGIGALAPSTTRNTGGGRRSNQVLGAEVSSDSADYTGTNGAPLDVRVDWANHTCALSGTVLGSIEDADTAVGVDLSGTIINEPPTASAAASARTVECTSPAATDVTLDASASTDPEDNIVLFACRRAPRASADVGGDPVVHGRFDVLVNFVIRVLLPVSVTIFLLFFVIDVMWLNRVMLIEKPMDSPTRWPEKLLQEYRPGEGDSKIDACLSELLDIKLIAARTAVTGPLIYWPFLLLALMIVSRLQYFDDWDFPITLIVVFALNAAGAIFAALTLRQSAEYARTRALETLHKLLYEATISTEGKETPAPRDRALGGDREEGDRGGREPERRRLRLVHAEPRGAGDSAPRRRQHHRRGAVAVAVADRGATARRSSAAAEAPRDAARDESRRSTRRRAAPRACGC